MPSTRIAGAPIGEEPPKPGERREISTTTGQKAGWWHVYADEPDPEPVVVVVEFEERCGHCHPEAPSGREMQEAIPWGRVRGRCPALPDTDNHEAKGNT